MAFVPQTAPPGPLGYIGDWEGAQNALTDSQLKTAADQAQAPYNASNAQAANLTATSNAQNALWKANHPLSNLQGADANVIAALQSLHDSGQYELENKLLQAWQLRQASLGATANYKNVMASQAPAKLKVSQQNSYANLNKQPGAKQIQVTNPGLFNAQPGILQGAATPLQNNSQQPTTAPINIPAVQNGVAVNAPNSPAPEGSNIPTSVAPSGSTTNEAVQGLPNAFTPNVNPDDLSDADFNRRKSIILSDIKATTTAKTYNRIEAGMSLENLLNSPTVDNAFNIMQQFKGQYGEGLAKEAQGWATNDPRYQQLSSARNQFNGIITGSLSALEGYPSTDQSVKMAKNYFQSAQRNFNMNPEQAKIDFEMGKQFARAETESLISTTPYKINDLIRNAKPIPPTPPGKTRVVGPDGKLYNIPLANLEKAKGRGFKEAP